MNTGTVNMFREAFSDVFSKKYSLDNEITRKVIRLITFEYPGHKNDGAYAIPLKGREPYLLFCLNGGERNVIAVGSRFYTTLVQASLHYCKRLDSYFVTTPPKYAGLPPLGPVDSKVPPAEEIKEETQFEFPKIFGSALKAWGFQEYVPTKPAESQLFEKFNNSETYNLAHLLPINDIRKAGRIEVGAFLTLPRNFGWVDEQHILNTFLWIPPGIRNKRS